MNKKKQESIARKNRIRTKRQQKRAKEERTRRHLMTQLDMLEMQAEEDED